MRWKMDKTIKPKFTFEASCKMKHCYTHLVVLFLLVYSTIKTNNSIALNYQILKGQRNTYFENQSDGETTDKYTKSRSKFVA